MIHDAFHNDQRLSRTATGVGAFIAEHAEPVPLTHILGFFRDPPLTVARALDELEALGYVRRVGDDINAVYLPDPATLGGPEVTA